MYMVYMVKLKILHMYGAEGKKMLWERIYIVRKREKMLGNKKKLAHGIRTRTCW
jgi:hypothetical protein